jgi:ParB-like chromosome segregation protein Spo0J
MASVEPLPVVEPGHVARRSELVTLPVRKRATVAVSVARLGPGQSLRETPIDTDHVRRLVATGGTWPPLLVRSTDLVVIDGLHRLAAAVELGLATTTVSLFDGSSDDALVEAIRANVGHGLPLTLSERKNAAVRLLAAHEEWSDRMVGGICGLAPSTVSHLRVTRDEPPVAAIVPLTRRLGRDGRNRPVDGAELRRHIAAALHDDPGASLRMIAARTGASPATVRAVRRALAEPLQRRAADGDQVRDDPGQCVGGPWSRDPACSSSEAPRQFAAWFDQTRIDGPSSLLHASSVPLSRVYEVADESLRRARLWTEFAAALESRPMGGDRPHQ